MAVDWNAVGAISTAGAAVIALAIWVSDLIHRHRERRATERFLAQVTIPAVATAQLEIAKLRTYLAEPCDGEMTRAHFLFRSGDARAEAAERNHTISSDDPEALEKLRKKLAALEAERECLYLLSLGSNPNQKP